MATNVNNFLLSLVAAMAAASGLALTLVNGKRSICAHEAIEEDSNPVFSVVRPYGSTDQGFNLVPGVLVQIDTRGPSSPETLSQAWELDESLQSAGHYRHEWEIPGKVENDQGTIVADVGGSWIVKVIRRVSGPGVIGRDEANRYLAVSSYEIVFCRKSAA